MRSRMTGTPNRSPSDFSTCGEGSIQNVTLDEIDFAAIGLEQTVLDGDGVDAGEAAGNSRSRNCEKYFGQNCSPTAAVKSGV